MEKENIQFSINISESLANSIRRYVNMIPILAIDEVEILKNESPLYDETIAHRMGLIPIKNSKTKDDIKLKLNSKTNGFVLSSEIKGDVEVGYDEIPITFLEDGKEIKINALVRSGIGASHSKFSPGILHYRNIADIKIDKSCPQEIVNICPKKVFNFANGKVVAEFSDRCDACESCIEYLENTKMPNIIKINDSEKLSIKLESFGQMTAKDIFTESINTLKKDLKDFSKSISKL